MKKISLPKTADTVDNADALEEVGWRDQVLYFLVHNADGRQALDFQQRMSNISLVTREGVLPLQVE